MSAIYGLVPLIVLVPIIPAYILFKMLGSQAQATGKEFFGFNVQLGGAFAGYFVLMLLLVHVFNGWLKPPSAQTIYHLRGQIVNDKNQGVALSSDNFTLMPAPQPMFSTNKNGEFDLSFIVDPNHSESYPSIEVSYGDFLPTDLLLDPRQASPKLKLTRDSTNHIIYAVEPITLGRAADGKDVHVSIPQPVSGVAAEYQNLNPAHPMARPPGYAVGPNSFSSVGGPR